MTTNMWALSKIRNTIVNFFHALTPDTSTISRKIRSQAAVGKLTLFVFGVITALVVFVAYNVLPFYYYYFEIENQFQAAIRVASTEDDQAIREKLMYHIQKLQIPVEPDDLIIERMGGNHMRISLFWQEVFYITYQDKDYDIWTFDFHAEVEDDF